MTAPASRHAPPAPGPWPKVPLPDGPTPDAPWAGTRSQVASFLVASLALGILCTAAGHPEWAVLAIATLGTGVALGLGAGLHRFLRPLAGTVAGAFAGVGVAVVLLLLWSRSMDAVPWGVIPLAWVLLVGVDWRLVSRLRALPFVFGLFVVLAVLNDQTWTFAAALVWLALALGSLSSLEADRRAAQPKAVPVSPGPEPHDVRATDLVTTVLLALAIALVAALVLSTPSCRFPGTGDRFGDLGSGLDPSELGEPGGTGGTGGTGSGPGPGQLPHQYVPDANGRFLIPNDGAGGTSSPTQIPSPDGLPGEGAGEYRTTITEPDGTTVTYERDATGTERATVRVPGQPERTFVYRDGPGGLTRIDELDEDGNLVQTYFYDPDGQVAAEAGGSVDEPVAPTGDGSSATDQPEEPEEPDDGDGSLHIDGWVLLAVAAALLALAGLVTYLVRRPGPPAPTTAPPWALLLARRLEDEGRQRGRPRGRAEPLAAYAAALGTSVLPDERMARVGAVTSAGLFAGTEPGTDAQHWAASALDEIAEAHPVPSRSDRRRAREPAT